MEVSIRMNGSPTQLVRDGDDFVLVIPADVIEKLGIEEGDDVTPMRLKTGELVFSLEKNPR